MGQEYEIFAQVRVADLLAVKKGLGGSEWRKAFNRISSKHVDFVLCSPDDLRVLACIELDDSSHNAASRVKRDDLLDGAFRDAGIPLLRIKARASYSSSDIVTQLHQATGLPVEATPPLLAAQPAAAPAVKETLPAKAVTPSPTQGEQQQKLCPKCASAMVKKRAAKGRHAGSYFLACTAYPACRTILPAGADD